MFNLRETVERITGCLRGSFMERISGFFAGSAAGEIPAGLRAAVEEKMKGEKIVACLRMEKNFYKSHFSFSGQTFFQTVAVLTDKRLLVLKDASEYYEIKNFPLGSVSSCSVQSDGGKSALLAKFFDGSENRLVFSEKDSRTEIFEKALSGGARQTGGAFCGQCGMRAPEGAKFCGDCGAALAFAGSGNTMNR